MNLTNIARYSTASGNKGWRVRIRKGPWRFTKNFLDIKYRGSGPALDSAIKYRDKMIANIPAYPKGQTVGTVDTKPRQNNSSGHPGVTFCDGWWRAHWSENGRRRSKGFSEFALGADAKQKAIEFRKQKMMNVAVGVVRSFALEDMSGITMLPKEAGWLVRLFYHNGKPKYQKAFYSTTCNGLSGALRKAVAYRDRWREDHCVATRREQRTGFVRDITLDIYEYVQTQVEAKTNAYKCANIRSDVEKEEMIQNVLLSYASKPEDEITNERHYLNTLIKRVVESTAQKKEQYLYKNPTWVDEEGERGEESSCLVSASM